MGKLIKNNLGNFLAIFILAILVFAGIFYYSSVNLKGAESHEIKILPTTYSGSWQNPEKALVIDLTPEAGFEEFNKENSTLPVEIEAEEPPVETSVEEVSSPSENDISTSPSSPSETLLRSRREIPFVLVIIKNLTRASVDLFGTGNLAASESEPDEDAQSVMPLVDISNPQISFLASEGGVVEGVASESEGGPIYAPLIPLDELEEALSTANIEETLSTTSEEIVSISEEPVIEFAPGFVESVLEFSGFDVPIEFSKQNGEGKKIKNIQLRMSLAFEGGGPQDSLIIEYSMPREELTEEQSDAETEGNTEPGEIIIPLIEEPAVVSSGTMEDRPVSPSEMSLNQKTLTDNQSNKSSYEVEPRKVEKLPFVLRAISGIAKLSKLFGAKESAAAEAENVGSLASHIEGEEWNLLTELYLSDPNSNASNGGYWLYALPSQILQSKTLEGEPISWEELKNLKIRFKYRGFLSDPMAPMGLENQPKGKVYLDAVWLEVEHESKEVEAPSFVPLSGTTEGKEDYEVNLISDKKDFKSDEEPRFKFKYQRKAEFLEKLGNLFKDEYKNINIKNVIILAPGGNIVEGNDPEGFFARIEYQGEGEFLVDLTKPRYDQIFKPGKYTLKFEIEDPSINSGQVLVEEYGFSWGVLAINTNKSIYISDKQQETGDTAYIQMAVLNDRGHTICDAKLKLEIREPIKKSGLFGLKKEQNIVTLSTEDGAIQYSGKCAGDSVVDAPDYFAYYQIPDKKGMYEMKLTNLDNGYEITDSFEVRESVLFDVERIGPTRIYPPATYEMKIRIKANSDFVGEIVETVPMLFAVTGGGILKQEPIIEDYTKKITWQAEFKAGDTYEIKYIFDAPDVSPYLYLLGPLRFYGETLSAINTESNQKALTDNQGSLIRRPVESNHIPQSGTVRLSSDGQNHLTSASPYLRNSDYNNNEIKSNTSNVGDVVFGSVNGNVTSPDNHFNYSTFKNLVKPSRSLPFVLRILRTPSSLISKLLGAKESAAAEEDAGENVGVTISHIERGLVFEEARKWQIASDTPDSTGMLVYSNDADATPHFRTWSGSDLGAAGNLTAEEANHGETVYTVLRANPLGTGEYIYAAMGYDTTDIHLDAQVYNGSTWGDGGNASVSGEFTDDLAIVNLGETWHRAFDVAYEQTTGQALVVYEHNAEKGVDATIEYVTWDGSNWSNENTYTYPAAGGDGDVRWIRMAPRPGTDDILIVFSDSYGYLYYVLWDGSALDTTNDAVINSAAAMTINHRPWDVAWETSAATAVIVYGPTTGNRDLCTFDGTTCTDQDPAGMGLADPADDIMWLELAADPSSDYIALMYTDTAVSMDLTIDMWNGSNFTRSAPTDELVIEEGEADEVTQVFDVAWEKSTSRALFVFTDSNAVAFDYFLYAVASDSYWCPEVDTNEVVTELGLAEGSSGPCLDNVVSFADDVSEYVLAPSNTDDQIMLEAYNDVTTAYRPEQAVWNRTAKTWTQTATQAAFSTDLSPDDAWTENSADNQPRAYDFAWSYPVAASTISGTCKQYDQTTNCADCTGCVRVAVNGALDADDTGNISGGSWTISRGPNLSANDEVTVFLNGLADTNEAVGVAKYDGAGDMSSMELFERHLSIGSDNSLTVNNTAMSDYDNSISGDEDVFHDVNGNNILVVCAVSGCENAELYIKSGITYQPDSAGGDAVETHDIEIDGTFDLTGTGNYASVSGGWNNDGVFTAGTSTIFLTATASEEIVSASAGSTVTFNNLVFGEGSTTSYTGSWSLNGTATGLDADGNMTIDGGTLNPGGNYNTNLAGNLTVNSNGNYTKNNGTFTFDGSTAATWTDNRTTKADMGQVSINGTTKQITLGSSVKANELTIAASQILDLGNSGYTLTISGDGQTTVRPLQNSGTLDKGSNSTVEYLASQSTDIEDTDYYNLTLASASTTFYLANSAATAVVSNSFNINLGTFDGGTDEIQLRGTNASPFVVSGVFTPSTSTISYEGDTNVNVASMSDGGNTGYYNLAAGDNTGLTAARTYTLNGNASVSYDLIVGATGGSYTHILDASSRTINLTGINDPFIVRTNGSFTESTSTVRYLGNGATTVKAETYYNLDIGESNSANNTYTADGNITASNQLSLQSAATGFTNTFALGANNLTVGNSSYTNSGGISVPTRSAITQSSSGTTTVRSNASGAATIGGAGTATLYNFTVGVASESNDYTFTLGGEIGVSNSFTIEGGHTATHSLAFSSNALSVWGNFDLSGAGASLSSQTGTAYFNGTGNTTFTDAAGENNSEFYNLTINKTNPGTDNVTLSNDLTARNTLTINDGKLVQGNSNVRVEGTTAVSVIAGAEWSAIGTGDLTLGGTFTNAGTVEFSTNNQDCNDVSDDIQILSTSNGSQRAWSGAGTFTMYNLSVQDQGGSITCYNCTSVSGNSWTFDTCVANQAPTIGEVNVMGTGVTTVTLIENDAIDIMASAYIDDQQGCTDIRDGGGVEAIFYSADKYWTPGQTGTCSLDYNNCIDNSVTSCSYQSCSGTIATYECFASSSLWYYANATTGSTASVTNGGWEVVVWASDSYWEDAASSSADDFAPTASNQAEVQILEAIDMAAASQSIAYDNSGANTDSTILERGVRNSGNRGINVQIAETETLVTAAGNQKYFNSSWTWPTGGTSLSASNVELQLELPQRGISPDADASVSDDQLFWGLHVPLGTGAGSYSGTNTYTSVAD